MADASTDDYLNNAIAALTSGAGNIAGNQAMQNAYAGVLSNLKNEMGDYQKLGPANYQNISAQQLGPSALAGIQPDAAARGNEQAAISQLGDIANSGGLELSDKNALNQLEQTQSRNANARNQSLANQYAARGQLGSGQQLAMQLANNQNATQNANQQGESIAADAQKRAMQAVMDKAAASRSMSQDDYARQKAAAEAADSISRYNSGLRTDASKYNNSLAGQTYEDQLKKLQGETGVTGSLNQAILGQGGQTAANAVGLGNAVGGLTGALSKGLRSGGGSSNPNDPNYDPGLDSSGQSDLQGNRGGAADLSGGAAGTGNEADAAAGTGAAQNADEWAQFASLV